MENKKLKEELEYMIAISRMREERDIAMDRNKIIISILVTVILVGLTIPAIKVVATRNIEYFDEKPVIHAGESIPNDIHGDFVYAVPSSNSELDRLNNGTETPLIKEEIYMPTEEEIERGLDNIEVKLEEIKRLERRFDEIMDKYYGKEEMDKIRKGMNEESAFTSEGFFEGIPKLGENGKILLQYALELIDTKNLNNEEKEIIKSMIQGLVMNNDIQDKELEERILGL